MRIRSFIIAYSLLLAILLFADRRPSPARQDGYSHVVDLTVGQKAGKTSLRAAAAKQTTTRMIAPGDLIPGTWNAGQIPAERLVAPLVVLDLNPVHSNTPAGDPAISLDDISAWEARHGMIPQGAVVAVRWACAWPGIAAPLPITREAVQFLIDARHTIGFAVEAPVDLTSDRVLARQMALRGAYVVEGTASLADVPATGSLVIVAPEKGRRTDVQVRVLAMVH